MICVLWRTWATILHVTNYGLEYNLENTCTLYAKNESNWLLSSLRTNQITRQICFYRRFWGRVLMPPQETEARQKNDPARSSAAGSRWSPSRQLRTTPPPPPTASRTTTSGIDLCLRCHCKARRQRATPSGQETCSTRSLTWSGAWFMNKPSR